MFLVAILLVPLFFLHESELATDNFSVRFPSEHWLRYQTPEDAGWDPVELKKAEKFYRQIQSAAVMAVYRGVVLISWGDIARRFNCHSIRKSYLSTLFGIFVNDNQIDLQKTMNTLGIDDIPPLTSAEKQARVVDLLAARSGIYHGAAYETGSMKRTRPIRGSHKPGSFWYYNNWDFNTLAAVFNLETGGDFLKEFKKRVAVPLQMEDFDQPDAYYHYEHFHSRYPAYPFRMSARDMARFGLLVQSRGLWNGKEVVASRWIETITRIHAKTSWRRGDYGFMWWISRDPFFKKLGMVSAIGAGGHSIDIIPGMDLVFVHRVDSYCGKQVSREQVEKLLKMVLNAREALPPKKPNLIPLTEKKGHLPAIKASVAREYYGEFKSGSGERLKIKPWKGMLILSSSLMGDFRLIPETDDRLGVADLEASLVFIRDKDRKIIGFEYVPVRGEAELFFLAKKSILPRLRRLILKTGISRVEPEFHRLKRDSGQVFDFTETELNLLGYELLRAGRKEDAILVFRLNCSEFPDAFNVYDSLGEAYLKSGDTVQALLNYQKAIRLNPRENKIQERIYQKQQKIIRHLEGKK